MVGSSNKVIIVGAGLSGLLLTQRLLARGPDHLQVTLIDPKFDETPARTWCFWGDIPDALRGRVDRTWHQLSIRDGQREVRGRLERQAYHMLAADHFVSTTLNELRACPRVRLVRDTVRAVNDENDGATVYLGDRSLKANAVFQSAPARSGGAHLLQHFGGWEIETDRPSFDPTTVTLMEFDSTFEHGTAFYYVLPIAADRALIEYTVISERRLARAAYDRQVRRYIDANVSGSWRVRRTEYGSIPLDPTPPRQVAGRHVFNIGRAAGLSKASTGYTLRRIIDQTEHLVSTLSTEGAPTAFAVGAGRFAWYDRVLLDVLQRHPAMGPEIFYRLFSNNPFDRVLAFLDEKTWVGQEMLLFAALPVGPFVRSALGDRHALPSRATT